MKARDDGQFARARALFPHVGKIVYFNSASYGPFSTPVYEAIRRNAASQLSVEVDNTHASFATLEGLRRDYAGLIGANKREVGVGLNTSFGLNIAAFGLPLKLGDEVLVSDVEFPAAVYTWRAASEQRGFKLTFVPSRGNCFDIDLLERSISKRSRALVLSYVQYFNGFKNDLAKIANICKQHNLWFIVDGIQGMGAEPINVKRLGIDVFSSGCQKWMLSPQGCGFFFLADKVRDQLQHPFMSWMGVDWKVSFTDLFSYDRPWFDSARRFELGYYATLNLVAMKESADVFKSLGIRSIQSHNHRLIDMLAEFLRAHPYYTITSSMIPRHRSSIFSFTCPDVKRLHRALLREKIILVEREGSIRVSVHLFNDESDIVRLIDILDSFGPGRE